MEEKGAILISDKSQFKTSTVAQDIRILHNIKDINPTRGYDTCKYLCT